MQAPDFNLPDQNGKVHSLKDYAGQWLALYFYPEDETSGCTTEACNFRDGRDVIAGLGNVQVVGISKDSVDSHKGFAEHHGLNFTILSDSGHDVIKAYGAWDEAKQRAFRQTFVINPNGEIVKSYEGVDPATHFTDLVRDLKELLAA